MNPPQPFCAGIGTSFLEKWHREKRVHPFEITRSLPLVEISLSELSRASLGVVNFNTPIKDSLGTKLQVARGEGGSARARGGGITKWSKPSGEGIEIASPRRDLATDAFESARFPTWGVDFSPPLPRTPPRYRLTRRDLELATGATVRSLSITTMQSKKKTLAAIVKSPAWEGGD